MPCWQSGIPSRWRWRSGGRIRGRCVADAPPSSMQWGPTSRGNCIRAGCGMPLITTRGKGERRCSGGGRATSFCNGKNSWRTVWHHGVLHGRMGRLRAAYRCREAPRGEGEHAKDREQAHQFTDPDYASTFRPCRVADGDGGKEVGLACDGRGSGALCQIGHGGERS